jgi:hypothetical protein
MKHHGVHAMKRHCGRHARAMQRCHRHG